MSIANEPDAPAQLYRSLNERLENSDKEGAIELYYELLSSGQSVGEILNGVGSVQVKPAQGSTTAAEQPRPPNRCREAESRGTGKAQRLTSRRARTG